MSVNPKTTPPVSSNRSGYTCQSFPVKRVSSAVQYPNHVPRYAVSQASPTLIRPFHAGHHVIRVTVRRAQPQPRFAGQRMTGQSGIIGSEDYPMTPVSDVPSSPTSRRTRSHSRNGFMSFPTQVLTPERIANGPGPVPGTNIPYDPNGPSALEYANFTPPPYPPPGLKRESTSSPSPPTARPGKNMRLIKVASSVIPGHFVNLEIPEPGSHGHCSSCSISHNTMNDSDSNPYDINEFLAACPAPTSTILFQQLQMIYIEICNLESEAQQVFHSFRKGYSDLTQQVLLGIHMRLGGRLVDFLMFATHSAADKDVVDLIENYSIAYRLWNGGVFTYLEYLRQRLPLSREYLEKYVSFIFPMLTQLVDRPHDSKHIWQEALGDIIKILISAKSFEEPTAYLEAVAKHWYWKASVKYPTIGRLAHNVSLLSTDLCRIFYVCKAMVSIEQHDSSYYKPEKRAELRAALCKQNKFFLIHYSALLYHMHLESYVEAREESKILFEMLDAANNSLEKDPPELRPRAWIPHAMFETALSVYGGMIAYCNIAAIMALGRNNNQFYQGFRERYGSKRPCLHEEDGTDVYSLEQIGLDLTSKFSRFYMNIPNRQALPYMITLMHFFLAIYKVPKLVKPFYSRFDRNTLVLIVSFINDTLETVKNTWNINGRRLTQTELGDAIMTWCENISDDSPAGKLLMEELNLKADNAGRPRYSSYRSRPLAEEHMLLGAIWPHAPLNPGHYQEQEFCEYDGCCAGYIGSSSVVPEREVKMIELALRMTRETKGFLKFNDKDGKFVMSKNLW